MLWLSWKKICNSRLLGHWRRAQRRVIHYYCWCVCVCLCVFFLLLLLLFFHFILFIFISFRFGCYAVTHLFRLYFDGRNLRLRKFQHYQYFRYELIECFKKNFLLFHSRWIFFSVNYAKLLQFNLELNLYQSFWFIEHQTAFYIHRCSNYKFYLPIAPSVILRWNILLPNFDLFDR